MAEQKPKSRSQSEPNTEGITRITVGGFKSINQEQSIEIKLLTILAGANSSGKSSMVQPLLLLKQTLEALFDPGALLLNGPNVRFTSADQLLSHTRSGKVLDHFHVGIETEARETVTTHFIRSKSGGFDVEQTTYGTDKAIYRLRENMTQNEIAIALSAIIEANPGSFLDIIGKDASVVPTQNRCFLTLAIQFKDGSTVALPLHITAAVGTYLRQIIHLPGLRGNPRRTYPINDVSSEFSGTFENYVASVIRRWQIDGDDEKLEKVNRDLARLGLTGKVIAKSIDDTQVELLVSRFLPGKRARSEEMVSIADVGFGVSQTLPVIVAIHAAKQGQQVYIEQPEIHLHPRAQYVMAEVLADAAKEGKRLIIETHSSLLLLDIQTLVAESKLPTELVKLHWFTRKPDGSTQIDSADLDERGAYGDWAEDFDDVTLYLEDRFLNAQVHEGKGHMGG
jgi:predicted ATPase